MALGPPTVLEKISTPAFVRYVLDRHDALSFMIICGTKSRFLDAMRQPTANQLPGQAAEAPENVEPPSDENGESLHPSTPQQLIAIPTLRMLAMSRTVKLVFCPDITHLRAYLATCLTTPEGSTVPGSKRILALLNPVALHRPTSAFSAQGLNRTLSSAVEAAHRTGSQLLMAECNVGASVSSREDEDQPDSDDPTGGEPQVSQSVWDEEVAILNVTTKTFGAGERGWVGRTVRLRDIAGRWFSFASLLNSPEATF